MSQLTKAYSLQNWPRVRKLMGEISDPLTQKYAEAIFNLNAPDGDKMLGLTQFKSLFNSENEQIKRQSMLSYARGIDLMKMRPDLFPEAASLPETTGIYQTILTAYPDNKVACYAIIFKCKKVFDAPKVDKAKLDAAFAELERFLAQPEKRDRAFLGIVHWFASNEYIAQNGDYKRAVAHLVRAGELGIANPSFLTEIRFQTARLYDIKLHDKKNALKYYKIFVKHYPDSKSTIPVKRFIKQLEAK
jgi:tetratricopeptide (TPR) repeat protein